MVCTAMTCIMHSHYYITSHSAKLYSIYLYFTVLMFYKLYHSGIIARLFISTGRVKEVAPNFQRYFSRRLSMFTRNFAQLLPVCIHA